MPFYHAVTGNRLPSILKHGLGGIDAEQNFDCERGVYLSKDPWLAVGFLLEHYFDKGKQTLTPKEAVEDFFVIVIDDARITGTLKVDPNLPKWEGTFFLHEGAIDVRGMPIIRAVDLPPSADLAVPDRGLKSP